MKTNLSLRSVLLALAATTALGAYAENTTSSTTPPPNPPPHHERGEPGRPIDPERRLARLTERLGLTADQQAKLRPILVAQAETMKAIEAQQLTPEQKRDKVRELHQTDREKIAAVLTPEQKAKFEAMRPERPNGPRGERRGPGGEPPPEAGK